MTWKVVVLTKLKPYSNKNLFTLDILQSTILGIYRPEDGILPDNVKACLMRPLLVGRDSFSMKKTISYLELHSQPLSTNEQDYDDNREYVYSNVHCTFTAVILIYAHASKT